MKMGAFVLAYHGCDREVAEILLAGQGKFRPSENDHDWLGHGVYFWENNPKRALEWAGFMASHPRFTERVKEPYAVGAIIDLGNCLDLTESSSLDIVRKGYYAFRELSESFGMPLPENKRVSAQDQDRIQRHLDCAVINYVHDSLEEDGQSPYSTVRGAFPEGGELYPGAGFSAKMHIQICVRNLYCIRGVFRIEDIESL